MITFEEIETGTRYTLSDFGLRARTGHSHPFASTRDKTLSIPGMHGAWDFGSDRNPIPFNFPLSVLEINMIELQRRLRVFSSFIHDAYGRPRNFKLILDYEPDKYYTVRYSGQIAPNRLFGLGKFDLPLTCFEAVAKFVVPSDEIIMDSEIPIMSDILWGTGLSNRVITTPETFEIINNGSIAILFTFRLEGSGNNVSLSTNGKNMTLGSFTNKTIETLENYIVKVNGVTDLTSTNGVFLELLPGVNEIEVSGSSLNLTISESLTYQYN